MKEDRERVTRLLANVGCYPQNFTGSKSFICPMCSHTRKQSNRRKKCLSVKSESDGVRYFCHHCEDMRGGFFYNDDRKDSRPHRNEGNRGKGSNKPRRDVGSYYR